MIQGCHAYPFHEECLEVHYARAHPRPQPAREKESKVKEEEVLQQESDEARAQWVRQMTNVSQCATPLGRKITGIAIGLVSLGLAVGPSWSPAAADAPVPLLQ